MKPFFRAATHELEVIAHRGGGGEWPGETMFAYGQAVKLGVDVLELDVRRTKGQEKAGEKAREKDGEIILMHNGSVDKTTDGTGCVRHLTMEQLKKMNAADSWATNPTFKFIPIAKLSEVIALLKANPKMRANIEIKPRDPALGLAVGEIIMKAGLQDRILIASAFSKVLKPFRETYDQIATSASVWEIFKFQLFSNILGFDYRPKTDAIQWHSRMLGIPVITHSFVKKAKDLKLIVHAWTVNEPEEMGRMIKLRVETKDERDQPISGGVDGIITDYPTTLMRILNR